jgi:hypothetical protein
LDFWRCGGDGGRRVGFRSPFAAKRNAPPLSPQIRGGAAKKSSVFWRQVWRGRGFLDFGLAEKTGFLGFGVGSRRVFYGFDTVKKWG